MPRLIRWRDGLAAEGSDGFTRLADDEAAPAGDVMVSLARFHAEGAQLLGEGRRVGVLVAAGEAIESLAYDLPAIAVVALEFPKFKDGRAYSAARLLRERFGYLGEVRAVGDVLLEQARFMIRCGFDAFEPADETTPEQWSAAARRYRHVYQRAADDLEPAFALRGAGSLSPLWSQPTTPSTPSGSPSPNGGGERCRSLLPQGGVRPKAGRGATPAPPHPWEGGELVDGEAA